ncbi:MAG: bifunctional precorrin-2 dehydrogenase/sirohydrochlorin ferrochelatase, partial [Ruminiclostridium sp.]|nr:bifunctional precorrin-2 dehydrogenase/sirohydrochlorin ferrochelatase [Ruminiclostridium sp.]
MAYFPFFIDIENKKILIVGGGNVALRKAEKLVQFGADIVVVAPEICAELERLDGVKLIRRRFENNDICTAFAVIAATNDKQLNARIYALCNDLGILVNTVDDPENCGFYFPALVRKNNVTVGISTGGTSPIFARYLREKTEELLDEKTLAAGDILADCRPLIKQRFDTEQKRRTAAEAVLRYCTES